jgi:hypothetical protein
MYASDIINRNRAGTLFINFLQKKEEFESGKSIRIDRQKGGNDYEYLKNVEFGGLNNPMFNTYIPLSVKQGSNPTIFATYNLTQLSFSGITEYGSPVVDRLDDGSVRIQTAGDFFFFGTNYAVANNIYWHTNNALTFGAISDNTASFSKNKIPAILLGNYDRTTSKIYSSSYFSQANLFSITVILVYFSNYYTDTTNLEQGKYQIRLIREINGSKRQWVEVTVISEVGSPGYSNNAAVTYPSGTNGSGIPIDSNGSVIDSTKNSPYDISDGTNFLNVMGSLYSTASPQTGTTLLYQSDSTGTYWNFTNNAYVPV